MMDLKKGIKCGCAVCILVTVLVAGTTVQAAPFSKIYLDEQWRNLSWTRLWESAEVQKQEATENSPEDSLEIAAGEFATAESIIFVGDSRVVGMAEAGGCHYVADIGVGYAWLNDTGISWLTQEMEENPYLPIVFCLGVNDLNHQDLYVSYYQSFLNQYPNRQIYFMSVNPVLEEAECYHGYHVSNTDIENFNMALMNAFPDRYIDVYSFLMANGYAAADGLHYDLNTYAGIQQYTLLMINMMSLVG